MSTSWGSNKDIVLVKAINLIGSISMAVGIVFLVQQYMKLDNAATCRKDIVYGRAENGAELPEGVQYNNPVWYDKYGDVIGYSKYEDSEIFKSESCLK